MKKIVKWGLIIFVGIIVLGSLASSNSSKPEKINNTEQKQASEEKATASTQTFKMGDLVDLDGKAVVVNSVKPYKNKNQFMTPKEGSKVVSVDVSLKNNSSDSYNYNVLDFRLQDNQDYTYTNSVSDIEPYITTGVIQPGQTTRGYITYEIPEENEPIKLTYTPSFFGTSQVIIELK